MLVLKGKPGCTDLSVTPLCLGGNVFGWTSLQANQMLLAGTSARATSSSGEIRESRPSSELQAAA